MIFITARLVAENESNIKITTTTEKQPEINQELITEVLEEEVNKEAIENDNDVKTEMVSSKLSQFQDLIFNIDGFDAIVLSFAPLFLILVLGLIFKTSYFNTTQKDIDLLRGKFLSHNSAFEVRMLINFSGLFGLSKHFPALCLFNLQFSAKALPQFSHLNFFSL